MTTSRSPVKLNKKEKAFVRTVRQYYVKHGRNHLPWRKKQTPYRVLVSEMMLQQTQVTRVIPKYQNFLKLFPTVQSLADASLSDVLRAWQGLGYNRRAKFLHQAAKLVTGTYHGKFPKDFQELQSLPGVGEYTAGAIMVFAYNKPVPLIETNVRQVFIHHFFQSKHHVSDKVVYALVEKTLPTKQVRVWFAALMDYGSHLKAVHGNITKQSLAYQKQSQFKGSDRQIRGALIKLLTEQNTLTLPVIKKQLNHFAEERVATQLAQLKDEGFIVTKNRRYTLA